MSELTASHLNTPVFLMTPPFTLENRVANNALMEDNSPVNKSVAFNEFLNLYNFISSKSLVYLLPHYGNFQDLSFVANIGITLPWTKEPTVILSNYASPPRYDEEKIANPFFRLLKYNVEQSPYNFEGEADLKYIRGNMLIGGYGMRTSIKTFHWMEEKYNCTIIPVQMKSQRNYHFDCLLFPLSKDRVLLKTDLVSKEELRKIENIVDIVNVPASFNDSGLTNIVRVGDGLLAMKDEEKINKWFRNMAIAQGLQPFIFDLDEYTKNGAALSCLVMHINRIEYNSKKVTSLGMQVKEFLK